MAHAAVAGELSSTASVDRVWEGNLFGSRTAPAAALIDGRFAAAYLARQDLRFTANGRWVHIGDDPDLDNTHLGLGLDGAWPNSRRCAPASGGTGRLAALQPGHLHRLRLRRGRGLRQLQSPAAPRDAVRAAPRRRAADVPGLVGGRRPDGLGAGAVQTVAAVAHQPRAHRPRRLEALHERSRRRDAVGTLAARGAIALAPPRRPHVGERTRTRPNIPTCPRSWPPSRTRCWTRSPPRAPAAASRSRRGAATSGGWRPRRSIWTWPSPADPRASTTSKPKRTRSMRPERWSSCRASARTRRWSYGSAAADASCADGRRAPAPGRRGVDHAGLQRSQLGLAGLVRLPGPRFHARQHLIAPSLSQCTTTNFRVNVSSTPGPSTLSVAR